MPKLDLGLPSYESLLQSGEQVENANAEKVVEIPIDQIKDFEGHPFHVSLDEDMLKLIDSIQENGQMMPVFVRPAKDGNGYEMISGHRRKFALSQLGLTEIQAIVRDLDDDQATILMVDSNIQREHVLPTERGYAYRMRLEAMKHQGKHLLDDATSGQVGLKYKKAPQTDQILAESVGESRKQLQRYIRITYLIKPIQDMVDNRHEYNMRIAFNPACEISFLKENEQEMLYEAMLEMQAKETGTKKGFVLDETEYEVTLEYAGQTVEVVSEQITATNKLQSLDLQVRKLFEENDPEAYKDVVFGVYSTDDITIGEDVLIPADGLVGLMTIDSNGRNVEQFKLPVGNYYVKELKTNVGYVLDEEEHPFTFEYSDDNTKASVTVVLDDLINTKRRLTLEVNKVDKDNHDIFLNGAVFEVTDKTTGEDMGILVSGKLALKGNAADEEYEIAADIDFTDIVKTAKTDKDKELIVEMPEGTYYVRRKAAESAEQTSDDAVTETTQVEDYNPAIKCIVKDGKAVLADAIYGHEYEFREIEAPKSYELSDALYSYKIEAAEGKEIVVYIFENKRIEVPNTGIR